MTRFLQDILRQPDELRRVIEHLNGAGRGLVESSAHTIRNARHIYITGIGASWNAALGAGSIFHSGGRPVYMLDAAELLQFSKIPPHAVILVLSRSGRSVEIVKRSEEHTSELQSPDHLVCRLLLEKKKK